MVKESNEKLSTFSLVRVWLFSARTLVGHSGSRS